MNRNLFIIAIILLIPSIAWSGGADKTFAAGNTAPLTEQSGNVIKSKDSKKILESEDKSKGRVQATAAVAEDTKALPMPTPTVTSTPRSSSASKAPSAGIAPAPAAPSKTTADPLPTAQTRGGVGLQKDPVNAKRLVPTAEAGLSGHPPSSSISSHTVRSPSGSTMQLHPQQALPVENAAPLPTGIQQGTHPPLIPFNAAPQNISVGRGNVSLNFDDADIYSVIQTVFGEILKCNYIIDARVKGRVTFRSVAPVPSEKVLPLMEVILRLNGVAIIEESSLYRIIPISDLSREPSEIKIGRKIADADLKGKAVLQVVPLNYMQSSEIIKLISPFVSANAVIVDVPRANHVIIADTDANVKRILLLIEYFDAEIKEKKGVRVFVHHVQNAKAKDLVNMLQQIYLGSPLNVVDRVSKPSVATLPTPSPSQRQATSTGSLAAGVEAVVSDIVKIFADDRLNAVVILGTREDYDIIKATIKDLDLIPRQVLIEGTIASIQLTDNMSLGLAWSIKNKLFNLEASNLSFNPGSLNMGVDELAGSGLQLIGIHGGGTIKGVINALASQSKAKLLASPHIMVSDNNEARIQVGQQVPIPTSETYGTTGVAPQRTIQYKDIGIILKVKPLINDSGLITLQISQEVSTYSTIVLYSDEKQIILNKTEATTNLVVKNGHTVVIGGLIREDDSSSRLGIPWLSKIPILGYLFGNTESEKKRTELVILLTPHIVKHQDDAMAVTYGTVDNIADEDVKKELKKSIDQKNHRLKEEEINSQSDSTK